MSPGKPIQVVSSERGRETCHLRVETNFRWDIGAPRKEGSGRRFSDSYHEVLSKTTLLCGVGTTSYIKVERKHTNKRRLSLQLNAMCSKHMHIFVYFFIQSAFPVSYQIGQDVIQFLEYFIRTTQGYRYKTFFFNFVLTKNCFPGTEWHFPSFTHEGSCLERSGRQRGEHGLSRQGAVA